MIKLLQRLLASMLLGPAVGILCAISPAVAWADHAVTNAAPEPHNDGIAYLLVLFCVALSIIILVRGSNRSPDVRLKDLEEE